VPRPIAVLILTVALLAGAAFPAVAGGPNNVVVANATSERPTVIRSSLDASQTGGDEVTSANIARAESKDCTGCRAVAVALQAVLMTGNPSTVTPTNAAVALNTNCTRCATFAFAYQYVVSTGGPAHLSPDGYRAIAQLRREAADLARSNLPFPELNARLEEVGARLKATVDEEIVRTGGWSRGGDVRERSDMTPDGRE
jgi:type II secretory pathway pseudopilin PulG